MAFTQTDLDNVNTAIGFGELRVEVEGRTVHYRSIDELLKARAIIQSDLAAVANTAASVTRRGSYRVNFSTYRGD